MDYDNQNIKLNYIFNILGEYSVYLFVCFTLGLGTLMYYLSIRTVNPLYDSPKLTKKKPKKEKQSRNKNVKNVPARNISPAKQNDKIDLKQSDDIIEVSKELVDDEDTTWLPVVKPKKNPKTTKLHTVTTKISECPKKVESVTVQTVSTINVKEKPKSTVKYESKSTVFEHICDKIELVKPVEKTVEIVPEKVENQPENICPFENERDTIEDLRNTTDSPTISLSDDFELVDSYKTSSEDGLKQEQYILRVCLPPKNSSTSGASRKKTKKQHKLISKQLIEAAKPIEKEEKTKPISSVVVMNEFKPKPPATSEVSKKKRPRKDL